MRCSSGSRSTGPPQEGRAELRSNLHESHAVRDTLVTADFHNEALFKSISYPTLGVETKFNE